MNNWLLRRAMSAPRGGGGDDIVIPTVYQRVEYIQSNGAQYIDTGVLPESTTALELDAAITSVSTSYYAADLAGVYGPGFRFHIGVYENKFHFGIGGAVSWINLTNFDTDRHTFKICGDGEYSLDAITGMLSPVTEPQFSIYLFGRNGNDVSASPCIVWRSKIYDNGVLVRDLIPCYRKSDGKPGMWDVVGWKFYENAGSGADFTVGPDVVQPATKYIVFEDRAVEAICVQNFSSDGIGVTMQDAAAVTTLNNKFGKNTSITKFLELVYFTSLTRIGTWDFYQCSNLAEVGFPPNATSIIFHQSPLTAMYVTGSLDKYLARETLNSFDGSPGIHLYLDGVEVTQITFPQSITSVPAYVLLKHKWITSINIPDTVTSIGAAAFQSCTGLTSILIPGVATLLNTFFGCTSLTNAVIKEGTTTIGNNTFRRCSNLAHLEFPSTITDIGSLSLAEISHLTLIIKAQTPPTLASNVWNITTIDAIYVPYSADHNILDIYKAAPTWSAKASVILELNPDGTIPS